MNIKELFLNYWYVVIGVALFICFIIFQANNTDALVIDEIESIETEQELIEEAPSISKNIFVEVKGAVKYPGVYELAPEARVKNVLEMAQLNSNADIMPVNQSQKLYDEMVVYVPTQDEVKENIHEYQLNTYSESNVNQININTASKEELMQLNGIGEKTALKIINYREENGLFMSTNDLKNISGIGEKIFQNLESDITVQ